MYALAGLCSASAWADCSRVIVVPAAQNAEYDTLVRDLIAENRVDFVNDLETIGRMLRAGRADFTILPPTLLYSALQLASAGIQTMWWPQTSAPT